jgi:lambda family phage minor tail protein L
VSDLVLRAAQSIDADALVELWEIDTTTLTNIYGVVGTGNIYRWTPGVLNYRMQGVLAQNSTTTSVILERSLGFPNPALNYTLQVEQTISPELFSPPIAIVGLDSTTGIGGHTVSVLDLATPLPQAPVAGMNYLIETSGTVKFNGIEYKPAPIQVSDMEWSGQGKLPRPRLRMSNIGGFVTALIVQFGDIVGAQVTRYQTFKTFLDGEATPDGSAIFEPDIFVIDRKSAHNKNYVEFELAALLDQQGIRLPRRLVARDYCGHTYRQYNPVTGSFVQGTCPYSDTRYYKADGSAGLTLADDVCGKHLSDCLLRFPPTSNLPTGQQRLPFYGFPGVAEVTG